jgi:hypothetical protein
MKTKHVQCHFSDPTAEKFTGDKADQPGAFIWCDSLQKESLDGNPRFIVEQEFHRN